MSSDWITADWPAPANIVAGTTTRRGGVSSGRYSSLNLGACVGDQPEHVVENRRRFVAMYDLPEEPCWLRQVHGIQVICAGATDVDGEPPQADAAIGRGIGDTALDAESAACFRANDRGRWQADLYGLARMRLASAGVTAVHGGEYCTAADPQQFFSHRRDGSCGRMATFIHRRS